MIKYIIQFLIKLIIWFIILKKYTKPIYKKIQSIKYYNKKQKYNIILNYINNLVN